MQINPKIELTVDKPWFYHFGAIPDKHSLNTTELLKDLRAAVKIAENVENIQKDAIEYGETIVDNMCVSGFTDDIVYEHVYVIDDPDNKDKRREQNYYETFMGALECVLGEDMPVRDPIYEFSYVNKLGISKHINFHEFSELVEWFYKNEVTEYSCPGLTLEEEQFLTKVQHYLVMKKLQKQT